MMMVISDGNSDYDGNGEDGGNGDVDGISGGGRQWKDNSHRVPTTASPPFGIFYNDNNLMVNIKGNDLICKIMVQRENDYHLYQWRCSLRQRKEQFYLPLLSSSRLPEIIGEIGIWQQ